MAKQRIFSFTEERRNITERGDLDKVKGFLVLLSDEKVAHRFWLSGGIPRNNSMNK